MLSIKNKTILKIIPVKKPFLPQPNILFSPLHTWLSKLFYHFPLPTPATLICLHMFLAIKCWTPGNHRHQVLNEWITEGRKERKSLSLPAKAYNFTMKKVIKVKRNIWPTSSIGLSQYPTSHKAWGCGLQKSCVAIPDTMGLAVYAGQWDMWMWKIAAEQDCGTCQPRHSQCHWKSRAGRGQNNVGWVTNVRVILAQGKIGLLSNDRNNVTRLD